MHLQKQTENINTWLKQLSSESKAAVSVDCVIFGYDEEELKILLIDCNMPPYVGMKSLLGDLVKSDEDLDQAALRVLEKRTGLSEIYMEQVRAFSAPKRHPLGRVISLAYCSLVKIEDYHLIDREDKHPAWIPINQINQLAFDHKDILNACYMFLQRQIREKPIGFSLLPKKFTLVQLQHLYEVVLGTELDKRNFRRKLNSLDILLDLGEIQQNVAHRPAKLYSFDAEKYSLRMKNEGFRFDI